MACHACEMLNLLIALCFVTRPPCITQSADARIRRLEPTLLHLLKCRWQPAPSLAPAVSLTVANPLLQAVHAIAGCC